VNDDTQEWAEKEEQQELTDHDIIAMETNCSYFLNNYFYIRFEVFTEVIGECRLLGCGAV
jgi:hypothetical protein